uniref:Uncharacterized protein n=1 Tax=Trichogramma kaykai TaxID=54128 RepID=A0ABD2WRP4_9HYME
MQQQQSHINAQGLTCIFRMIQQLMPEKSRATRYVPLTRSAILSSCKFNEPLVALVDLSVYSSSTTIKLQKPQTEAVYSIVVP